MIGKILGERYEIQEKIGSGGMADVYKAYCTKLNRFVAVKVLKNEFRSDEEFVDRFKLESQAAAGISHSNIVSVYDVGFEDDMHYIVMEYVDGITLKEYINTHGMLPWRQALDFSIQICDAMEHAHREGIIHRDIKPQNIMVTSDNTLKVMDFGIARTANKDITTDSNTTIGTVHYISPEQARGGYVDERSDIYSMGVVMYEMLTGRVPFDGETAVSIAIMHMQNRPVPPRDIVLSVPYELEAICLKAMAKELAERYNDSGELLSDLRIMEKNIVGPVNTEDYKTVEEYEPFIPVVERKTTREPQKRIYKEEKKTKPKKNQAQLKADKKAKIILAVFSAVIVVVFAVILIIQIKPGFFGSLLPGNIIGGSDSGSNMDKYPDLVGLKVEDVEETYKNDKFVNIIVVKERVESVEYGEGYIVSQEPAAGTKIEGKKISIKVKVSKGVSEGLTKMPDFVNKHYEEAGEILDKHGISYKIIPDSSDDIPKNFVISQEPKAGEVLDDKKTVVTLRVNNLDADDEDGDEKDELTEVPSVIGYDSYDAKSEVEEAGFVWGTVTEEASDKPKGTVISQSPDGGAKAKKGYRISVVLSSGSLPAGEGNSSGNGEDTVPEVQEPSETDMKTSYLTITLPTDRELVNVSIKIGGQVIHEQQYETSAETADIRLTSRGTKNVEVYFDGELSDSITINFDE